MAAESTISSITPLNYGANEDYTRASESTILALFEQAERYATGNETPLDHNQAAMYYLEVILRDLTGFRNIGWRTQCYQKIAALNEQTKGQEPYVLYALGKCYLHGAGMMMTHLETARTHFLAAHKAQPTETLFMQAMSELYRTKKSNASYSFSGSNGYTVLIHSWEFLNNLHNFSLSAIDAKNHFEAIWGSKRYYLLRDYLEKFLGYVDYQRSGHSSEFTSLQARATESLKTLEQNLPVFNEIKSRLEQNINLDSTLSTPTQEYPIAWAIQHDNIQLAEQLIEAGVSLTDKPSQITFFALAKQHRLLRVVSAIRQKIHHDVLARYKEPKKDINTPLASTGMAPLLTLILVGHNALALKLIDDGAKLSCQTAEKATPLHFAALCNNQIILRRLLGTTCQFQQDQITSNGRTPLHLAARWGHLETTILLLKSYEADPCIANTNGSQPLHLAVIHGHEQLCNYLLTDQRVIQMIHQTTNKGNTPLHLAAKHGHSNITLRLLEKGASLSINEPNSEGDTPLSLAIKNKHDSIARILLLNGAQPIFQESNVPTSSSNIEPSAALLASDAPVFLTIKQENAIACVAIYEKIKNLKEKPGSSAEEQSPEIIMLESLSRFIKTYYHYPLSLILTVFNNNHTVSAAIAEFINTLYNTQDKELMVAAPALPELPNSLSAISSSVALPSSEASITDEEDSLFSSAATSYKAGHYSSYNPYYCSASSQPFPDWVLLFDQDTSPSQIERIKQRLFADDISPICFDIYGNTLLHYAAAAAIKPLIITLLLTETSLRDYINHRNRFGNSPYLVAIAHNNLEMIEIFKNFGLNTEEALSQINHRGDTPLHLAASWSHNIQSVNNLLEKAPHLLHTTNHNGKTLLHIAAQAKLPAYSDLKFTTISRKLLLMGANPMAEDSEGQTCFQNSHLITLQLLQEFELEHRRAKRIIFGRLKTLDSNNISDAQEKVILRSFIDAIDTHQQRPLTTILRAFQMRKTISETMMAFLTSLLPDEEKVYLTLQIDPTFIDTEELPPLQSPVSSSIKPLRSFREFLLTTDYYGNMDFITYLQSKNYGSVNFEEIDDTDDTLLHHATRGKSFYRSVDGVIPGALRWLLENTVLMYRTHLQNRQGETPFYLAAGDAPKYRVRKMELLSQAFSTAWQSTHENEEVPFIELHQPNAAGDTPLHNALISEGASIESCRYLLEHGAPIDHQNHSGRTPLHYALRNINTLHHRGPLANLPMPLLARTLLLNNANPDLASTQNIVAWQITEQDTPVSYSYDTGYNYQTAKKLNEQKTTVKQFFEQIQEEHYAANIAIYEHTKILQKRSNTSAQIAALEALTTMIQRHPHRPLSLIAMVFKTTPIFQNVIKSIGQQSSFFTPWDKRCDLEKLIDSFIKEEDKRLIVKPISYKEFPSQDLYESISLSAEDFEKCIALATDVKALRDFVKLQLFSYRKNPTSSDNNGNTLLHLTAQYNLPILDLLLDTELFLYLTFLNNEKLTPFAIAATHGHVSVMKQLYEVFKAESRYLHQTIFTLDPQKNSLFHLATAAGHQEVLSFLFKITKPEDCPTYINAKNKDGNTPLHLAVQTNNRALVIQLLKNGADPRLENNAQFTCLPTEDSEIRKILLTEIERLNNSTKKPVPSISNGTWSFFSSSSPTSSSAPMTESNIKLAFLTAIRRNDITTMLSLYESTPDAEKATLLTMQDEQKNTPLHLAAQHGCTNAGAFLLRRGAPINSQNELGNTPLHLAIINEHPEFLTLLLLHDANPHLINTEGKTPWQFDDSSAFSAFQQMQNDNCQKLKVVKDLRASTAEKANSEIYNDQTLYKALSQYNALTNLLDQLINILTIEENRYACFSTIFNQQMKDAYQAYLKDPANDAKIIAETTTFLDSLKTPGYREHFPGELPPELPSAPSYSGDTLQNPSAAFVFDML
jgi:ankyrin repeat protein